MTPGQKVVNMYKKLKEQDASDEEILKHFLADYFTAAEAIDALANFADQWNYQVGQDDDKDLDYGSSDMVIFEEDE